MSDATCPRCGSGQAITDFEGVEGGVILWTIRRCAACCFSWRDSEPRSAIDRAVRSADFALDVSDAGRFPIVLPQPAQRG